MDNSEKENDVPEKKIKLDQQGAGNKQEIENVGETDEEPPRFVIQRPPIENNFVLEQIQSKSFKQSNAAKEITYRAKLANPSSEVPLTDLISHIQGLFETILEETRRDYGESGVIRIYISHPNLEKPIIVPPTHIGYLTAKMIIEHIENVLYSAGHIPADNNVEINVAVVEMIKGSGRVHVTNVNEDKKRKRCIVNIRNSDNSCLPRAIIVGYRKLLADENKGNSKHLSDYRKVCDSRNSLQGNESEKLRKAVKIPNSRPGCLTDIILYERYLRVSIVVISSRIGNQKVYNGCPDYNRKIYLYHSDNSYGKGHFDTITKMNAMMCTQYYCNNCDKGFKSRNQHKCKVWCNVCGKNNCSESSDTILCSDCNKTCRSFECFQQHKIQPIGKGKNKGNQLSSMCDQFWQCLDCGLNIKKMEREISTHECGESLCKVCKQYHLESEQHLCYMRMFQSENNPEKFIFYDFESIQDGGKHVPNFVVAQSICTKCEKEKVTPESTCNNCGSRCYLCDKFNKKEQEYERIPCLACGKRQVVFSGKETVDKFCEWLFGQQHRNFTVIAHNARAYDAYFIYNFMMRNSMIPDPTIFSGSKLMYMKAGKGLNIRIIDSLNFLPMPLSALPKSFGLTELKKGYFPHFYNKEENWGVKLDKLPDIEYYDPDSMCKSKRDDFMKWYEENKDYSFDFQKEMYEYCVSDVDILLQACWKFRSLLRKKTGNEVVVYDEENLTMETVLKDAVDPFSFLTIASVCLGIFRSKFLEEEWKVLLEENEKLGCKHERNCLCQWLKARKKDSSSELKVLYKNEWVPRNSLKIVKEKFVKSKIGLIPVHGYSGKDNHSMESIQWLNLLEKQWKDDGKSISIQHARNCGEKIIHCRGKNRDIKYRIDGYFEWKGEKYVCEYNGCHYHGCMECYPRDREKTMNNGKSIAQRFRETMLKEKRLKELGYNLIVKWSCEFYQEIKENAEFINSLNIQKPIDVRDCYFGGRTNALVLHKIFKGNEKGKYVDFTSLYPDILKYKKFPVGHPERIIDNFKDCLMVPCENNQCDYNGCRGFHKLLPYFGIMKATFKPPTDLIHPVLPLKCNGKLKFPLCLKCAQRNAKEQCRCETNDRCFTQTYCTPEVEVALNEGYEIVKIHEVLHWKDSEEYNPESKTGGLFTEYINSFLKIKQEASGYPQNIYTEDEKDLYIEKYLTHEGIKLDKEKVEKNPGLRSISKLALNSFYGKFGQRTNMKKTQFVNNVGDLYRLFTDPSKEVIDFHIMSDDIMEVEFKNTTEFEPLSINTNVVVAAFCTSWARLKLLAVMRKLGRRVLYHDTDSIIYSVTDEDTYVPPLGEYLGDLTDELSCKEVACSTDNCNGHWIQEFVSCGPKNYSFKLNTGQVICKVRGFSLNHKASLVLNFESMKSCLFNWMRNDVINEEEYVIVKNEIRRNKYTTEVFNRTVNKKYSVVYDKRVVFPDYTTIPFGYKF